MENTKEIIAGMVNNMSFDRKKPPTKHKKTAYAAIKKELDDIAHDIDALRLALWYAEYKRDYHKLSPANIKKRLSVVNQHIDDAIRQHLGADDAL